MNGSTNSILASRVRGLGKELLAIAAQLDAQAPHLSVNLPRDLFSELDEPQPQLFEGIRKEPIEEKIKRATESWKGVDVDKFMADVRGTEPDKAPAPRKTWKRVGCKMQDTAIVAAEKVGRRSGWCQRSDIERSILRRMPMYGREEIREAVNYAVQHLGLTCIVYNSYKFYRRKDREDIMEVVSNRLAKLS